MMVLIGIGVVVLVLLFVVGIYNALVRRRNEVQNSWNQIDVQLKRRHDLIPNLVETAKGYVKHEREVLENVTRARNLAQGAQGHAGRIDAETKLGMALTNLFAVAENYPDLKANQNFLALQEELTSTENKIAFARQAYNDAVMHYNNKRQEFPSVIIAGMFNFKEEPYWRIEDAAERAVPKVSFS
ncbi:MAG: LemA family protein [Deltaproteobacteria bacterium]|nr:LemA family protein [Deltaproteobacteria bacterium]